MAVWRPPQASLATCTVATCLHVVERVAVWPRAAFTACTPCTVSPASARASLEWCARMRCLHQCRACAHVHACMGASCACARVLLRSRSITCDHGHAPINLGPLHSFHPLPPRGTAWHGGMAHRQVPIGRYCTAMTSAAPMRRVEPVLGGQHFWRTCRPEARIGRMRPRNA